ncbi:MAG: hypothetical protein ACIAXF_13360 [Phycisphaerales bacterium JB063]
MKNGTAKPLALMGALLLLAFSLVGCDTTPPVFVPENDPSIGQLETSGLTYREVAEGYNATVSHFETLFLRTYVRMVWQETRPDGSTTIRREAGDGKFLFRAPSDTVLTIEKISKVYLWAGSNASQYWLFDQVNDDHKVAYVGSYSAADPRGGSPGRRLPIAFRPDAMPYLLGLVALDPTLESEVFLYEGQYLIEPVGLGMRMLIDPNSFRPTRVDLLDAQGWSVVVCQMSGRYGVEVEGLPGHRLPIVCEDAELFITGQQSRLSIEMIAATTSDRRIRDQLFDLDTLIDALEPDEVVDLDGG